MVKPVKYFEAQSDVLAFRGVEILEHAQVPVLETRLVEDIAAALVCECALSRPQNIDTCLEGIPLAVRAKLGRLSNIAIHDPTATESVIAASGVAAARTHAGKVIIGLCRNRRTGLQLRNFRDLPTAQQLARKTLCVVVEGQFVDEVDDRYMTMIVI